MKTQIVLPDPLMISLRKTIPRRQRSRFIAEAVERRLASLRLREAMKEASGAWSDASHRDLRTAADVSRYMGRFRARFK